MSNNFTLDDIRAAAEAEYADMTITLPDAEREDGFKVTLVNPLRLTAEKRAEVTRLQSQLDAEEGDDTPDHEEVLRQVLRVVAAKQVQADKLDEQLTDLTMLAATFKRYSEVAQVGEA